MFALLLVLVALGFGLYLVETYVPMAQPMKLLIRALVVVFVVWLLMGAFGVADVPLPRFRS